MNLRISNIYYFLLNLRYISFSAHEKDILSILKAKKFSSLLRLTRGFKTFLYINLKLRKGHSMRNIHFFKFKIIDE